MHTNHNGTLRRLVGGLLLYIHLYVLPDELKQSLQHILKLTRRGVIVQIIDLL